MIVVSAIIPAQVLAEPVPRLPRITGQVAQTKMGEDISIVEAPGVRGLEVRQDVKAGDLIRTNAVGQIALVFADRTQIRLGRNSALLVKEIGADGGIALELQRGQLFGRAERGGSGVSVQTPAATAAIRGTDWSLSVEGERTTLTVIEGLIDLSNPQGSVSVATGQSAAATIGARPSRIVIAGGDIREQMLYNLSLREAFNNSVTVGPDAARLKVEAQRLAALPAERWTGEDLVSAAETAFDSQGHAAAEAAVTNARAARLSAVQKARIDLVEGRLAADAGRYADAARLFETARRGLAGERRVQAEYLGYFARSLANPTVVVTPPRANAASLASVMGEEMKAAILDSPSGALDVLLAAEPRFGGDVRFQVAIANRAMLASKFEVALTALRKAERADGADPAFLDARAAYRSYVEGDVRGAIRDLREAVERDPAKSAYWNNLGQLEAGRLALKEAEAAYRKAIELDPKAPEPRANLAGLLLYSGRHEEARQLIEDVLADDPSFEIGLFQRGRSKLLAGDAEGGLQDMLRATAANPTYGKGLIALGATYAARHDMDPAAQSFELADMLDPLSPITAQYRALLELYEYDLDKAIELGRESVKRARARGGDFSSVEASDDFGSTLGGIYRTAALDAWARYWGDRAFDPFQGASYYDQNLSGSVSPFATAPGVVAVAEPNTGDDAAFSGYIQGTLLDPLAIASPRRHPSFYRAPFEETEIGVGVTAIGSDIQFNGTASYQKLGYDPLPFAFTSDLTYSYMEPSYAEQTAQNLNSLSVFGAQLTPDDRIVGYINAVHVEGGVSFDGAISDGVDVTRRDTLDADGLDMFLGWSHTFEYNNVLNLGLFGSILDRSGRDSLLAYGPGVPPVVGRDVEVEEDDHSLKLGLSHMIEVVDDLMLRWGVEGGHTEYRAGGTVTDYLLADPTVFVTFPGNDVKIEGDNARAWIGGTAELSPSIEVEANLFIDWFSQNGVEDTSFNPHVGAAWEIAEGQYLRSAYVERTPLSERSTLSPLTTVGLRADNVPDGSGETKTSILRWDAEWSDRLFTAVEYQHQEVEDLSISLPVYSFNYYDPAATIDRLSVNANLWIGHGLSAFANYSHVWAGGSNLGWEDQLPTVPENTGRVGLSYTSPERFTVFVAESYIGERMSFPTDLLGATGAVMMDDAFVTDIGASWESEDRRLAVSFSVSNLFDEDVDVAPLVPGPGRVFSAMVRGRF